MESKSTDVLGVLPVYGSLEAFFIVFSVYKIDKALSCERLLSKGLLFGLMHATNYFFHLDVTLILKNYVLLNIIPAFLVGLTFKESFFLFCLLSIIKIKKDLRHLSGSLDLLNNQLSAFDQTVRHELVSVSPVLFVREVAGTYPVYLASFMMQRTESIS